MPTEGAGHTPDVTQLQPGTRADVAGALALIDEAREWLRVRSIDQWQHEIPESIVRQDADDGRLFVMRDGGAVNAIVTISDADDETWGPQRQPALYVHRLAVARSQQGSGLGASILDWVAARARAQGRRFVRLDCANDNPGLRRFYEGQGFRYVRDIDIPAPSGGRLLGSSLYQRIV